MAITTGLCAEATCLRGPSGQLFCLQLSSCFGLKTPQLSSPCSMKGSRHPVPFPLFPGWLVGWLVLWLVTYAFLNWILVKWAFSLQSLEAIFHYEGKHFPRRLRTLNNTPSQQKNVSNDCPTGPCWKLPSFINPSHPSSPHSTNKLTKIKSV